MARGGAGRAAAAPSALYCIVFAGAAAKRAGSSSSTMIARGHLQVFAMSRHQQHCSRRVSTRDKGFDF